MEYLIEYGMFLAKAVTIVVAVIMVIGAIASAGQKQRRDVKKGTIKISKLNEHLQEMRDTLRKEVLSKAEYKQLSKQEKKLQKAEQKKNKQKVAEKGGTSPTAEADGGEIIEVEVAGGRRPRVYVLNFKGNIAAEGIASLREEITAVLSMASEQDEVLLRLESPGGMVHAYGLAASQLTRITSNKVRLVICVDKVAASGGYMMACLADKLVAAPFAIIGSIGVLVQLPNFNRVLKKHDIDYEMISAGEYKRTLTTFGEITEKGREKVKEDVETIHELFKSWVKDHRPSVDINKVATGEVWLGTQAKERYMVDEIRTSDECIIEACQNADVFEVEFKFKKSLQDRLGKAISAVAETFYNKLFLDPNNDRYQ